MEEARKAEDQQPQDEGRTGRDQTRPGRMKNETAIRHQEETRAELDRVVTDAIVPERARTRPQREQQEAAAALRAEWEKAKADWK